MGRGCAVRAGLARVGEVIWVGASSQVSRGRDSSCCPAGGCCHKGRSLGGWARPGRASWAGASGQGWPGRWRFTGRGWPHPPGRAAGRSGETGMGSLRAPWLGLNPGLRGTAGDIRVPWHPGCPSPAVSAQPGLPASGAREHSPAGLSCWVSKPSHRRASCPGQCHPVLGTMLNTHSLCLHWLEGT